MFRAFFAGADWQQVMPGVDFCRLHQETLSCTTPLPAQLALRTAEIFFCLQGHLSLQYRNGQHGHLEPENILLLSSCDHLHHAEITAPLDGFCLHIDETTAKSSFLNLCQAYGNLPLTMKQVEQMMQARDGICLISAQSWCHSTFRFLQNLTPENRPKYCIMKCFELLYLLSTGQTDAISPTQKQESSRWVQTAEEMQRYLLEHLSEKLTIQDLSYEFHLSATACKTCFRTCCGQSIHQWLANQRLERAAELLRHSSLSVIQIAQAVGYTGCSQFNAAFKKKFCQTPSQYRNSVCSR